MVEEKIIAGISISLSGKYRLQGEQALRGVELWVSYANRNGGIYVRDKAKSLPVELVAYDDGSKTDRAKENVGRLLKENGVDILLGPYSSVLTMAVAPLAESDRKILWNHSGASDAVCPQGRRYMVNVLSPASHYFRSLPFYLSANEPSLRRLVCLTSSAGTFPARVAQGLEDAAGALGLTLVHIPFTPPFAGREVLASAPLHESDFVIGVGSFEDDVQIASRLAGTKPLATVAAGSAAFGQILGGRSEGVIGPSQWEPDPMRRSDLKGPDCEWFCRQFEKTFGASPEYTAAQGFAAGLVIQETIRQSGALDDERLRNAVADLDIHTFYGAFRIDPESGCQIGHQTVLVRWQSGKKVVIRPLEAG